MRKGLPEKLGSPYLILYYVLPKEIIESFDLVKLEANHKYKNTDHNIV